MRRAVLSVLVVEDEPIIRRKIVDAIDWTSNGMGPVYEAADGREALSLLDAHHIDIMVTDIQMPGLNGLELMSRVKSRDSAPRVVVISGYAEFEYARASIKLDVEDYVLKPFRAAKLLQSLKEVCNSIEARREELARTQELRNRLENSKESLREKLFADLVRNGSDPALSGSIAYLGLESFTGGPITVAILSLVDAYRRPDSDAAEAPLLHNLEVYLATREQLEQFDKPWYLVNYAADQLVLIAACEDWELGDLLQSILQSLVTTLGTQLCVGIGRSCTRLEHSAVSYRDAEAAVRLRFLYGANRVFYSRDIADDNSGAARLTALQHTSLYDDLRIGAFAEVIGGLPELFAQLRDADLTQIAAVVHNVVLTACAVVTELGHSVFDIFDPDFNPFVDLNDFATIDEMEQWLEGFFVTVNRYVTSHRNRRNAALVVDMKRYVNEHYHEPLSLKHLSRQFGISPSYVSVLFSNEIGTNFTDYVTDVRIVMAKQLLRHSTLHVYEIAEEVGFRDAYYFSTCFKKVTGRTPSEYRKGSGEESVADQR
ncbi:MAG: response regulator [Spirochaetaceae bacterium]|nr:MAG: response regulator [Spirochaetaceae bacterium]